ncbi:MAG: KamA family radical SAM protein [Bdellovibrionales bacterium]|nr:KamA family radical SAM protein [Bdellovibrionales bacterium]
MKLTFNPAPINPLFYETQVSDWNSWNWQIRNALKTKEQFEKAFTLKDSEAAAFDNKNFQIQVTPYYASLASDHPEDPIRKILMPQEKELKVTYQQMLDPLGEKNNNPSPRIIHRYPDRLLFLVTDYCSVYCRYCTRKHFTGKEQVFPKADEYQDGLDYIRKHTGIREVILSGGDPLTLSDQRLLQVVKDLRQIEHVEIIRIGTRMPVVCPMRISESLVSELKKYGPIYFMLHFNHPKEITKEARDAVSLLVDNGMPCFNQMVLLNGVNNDASIVQALSRRLLYLRVKPYYMFQCDPSEGTDHLRTSVEDSLQIQKDLWGNLSGLAMPNLSLDIPNGGGKTSYVPNFETFKDNNIRSYVGWDGISADYISPLASEIKKPIDVSEYQAEWDSLKNAKLNSFQSGEFSDKGFQEIISE